MLRRIKESTSSQSARGDEVPPLRASVSEVEIDIGRAKCAIGGCCATVGRSNALTRARGYVDDQARLVAVFGGRRAGNDLERLNRIPGDLVGKYLALLIRDGLERTPATKPPDRGRAR